MNATVGIVDKCASSGVAQLAAESPLVSAATVIGIFALLCIIAWKVLS